MQREQATEKELALLLRRHNKIAKAKLKSAEIDIPDYILTILCQKNARTDSQVEEIESFRANAIEQLLSVSNQLHEERLKKAKRTREANLEKDPRYVKHFGIWINSTLPTAKLNREHYAKIDRYSSFHSPAYTKYLAERGDERFVLDETGECGIYSEEWCKTHQKCCLKNFDINMERFASLDAEAFERVLSRFIKGRKFQEIYRLDEPVCIEKPYSLGISGFVYIMVFDAYKTAYIGITTNTLKQRIEQHWKRQRAFDRLIFGSTEKSVLSIDSFGPLDTTRIYILPYTKDRKTELEDYEHICIKAFDNRYLLNRLR